jgi:stage III sporulation protein AH
MKIIKFYTKYINCERMKEMKKLTDGKKTAGKTKKGSIRSRQVLVGALAVMVVAAGYYRYSVSNGVKTGEDDLTVPVMSTSKTEENYFASARRERDSARSEAEEMVKQIAENDQSTADAKAEANLKLKNIAENIKNEGEIESIIKSKGYDECIVFIEENEVRVIVKGDKLESDKVAQISEIVTSRTKFKPSQIVISCHK